MTVSVPARDPAVACDRPRYTNMYETRNETANLARTLRGPHLGHDGMDVGYRSGPGDRLPGSLDISVRCRCRLGWGFQGQRAVLAEVGQTAARRKGRIHERRRPGAGHVDAQDLLGFPSRWSFRALAVA